MKNKVLMLKNVKFERKLAWMNGLISKYTYMLIIDVLLSLYIFVKVSVLLFEKQISFIEIWQLKITFLSQRTKIFFFGQIFI